jgi:hypothetical protein
MKRISKCLGMAVAFAAWAALAPAFAQTCSTASDMDASTKAALETTVRQYFQLGATNPSALQAAAVPDFSGVANVVSENKALFAGQPSVRSLYLLDNSTPSAGRAEFYCGIFNSPDRVGFVFGKLGAGKYAVVVQDVKAANASYVLSWILRQEGAQWKIAGLVPKNAQLGGHDANWFLAQARAYKAKGMNHNAWFYYLFADQLLRPFPAMSTPQLDKLYDEAQQVLPKDLPYSGPVDLVAAGRTYKVTQLFPTPVGDALDLVVKYQVPDVSDTAATYKSNMDVIKALVAKYPEFREAFTGIVARAVDPSGKDYGSLLAIKDVK